MVYVCPCLVKHEATRSLSDAVAVVVCFWSSLAAFAL
jgi:hypothetical protein